VNKEDPADCPFCGIFERNEPVSMIWQDDRAAVFVVLQPVNPGNVIVVPKQHLPYLADLDDELAMHMMRIAMRVVAVIRESGLPCDGINLFLADGEAAGQEVFHSHLHVYPRFKGDGFGFKYDPTRHFVATTRAEMDQVANKIRAQMRVNEKRGS
jgi:histidine triad (HIT) family protein